MLSDDTQIVSVDGQPWRVPRQYKFCRILGSGAYGTVAQFVDLRRRNRVAIKRISNVFRDTLDAKRILRELKVLRHFRDSKYVIRIQDILAPESPDFEDIYIVMECADHDLYQIIYNRDQRYDDRHIQFIFFDLLKSFAVIHRAGIVHRDVKPSNVLINLKGCTVKLCDFGLARQCSQFYDSPISMNDENAEPLTEYVITRWYRPPEVLLDAGVYDQAVDIWGIGCIFAEVLRRTPLFPGRNNTDQIRRICATIPRPKNLDRVFQTPPKRLTKMARRNRDAILSLGNSEPSLPLHQQLKDVSPVLVDLIEQLLAFEPWKRITAERALQHPYFHDLYEYDLQHNAKLFDALPPMDWRFDSVPLLKPSIRRKLYEEIAQNWHREILGRDLPKLVHMGMPLSQWIGFDSDSISRNSTAPPVSDSPVEEEFSDEEL